MSQWKILLILFIMIPSIKCIVFIPSSFFQEVKEIPLGLIDVNVTMKVIETKMDFDNDMLFLTAEVTQTWVDKRRQWEGYGIDVVEYDSSQLELNIILHTIWMPNTMNLLRSIRFKNMERERRTFVSIDKFGRVTLRFSVILAINCIQKSSSYPNDQYECWARFTEVKSPNKLNFRGSGAAKKKDDTLTLTKQYKHDGHKMVNMSYYVKNQSVYYFPYTIQFFEFGFVVERDSPRTFSTVVVPIYLTTILDGFLFIFAPSFLLKIAMIPAYLIHFEEMSFTNTITEYPPIARWFFARFISSMIANIFFFAYFLYPKACIKSETDQTTEKDDQTTQNLENDERTNIYVVPSRFLPIYNIISPYIRQIPTFCRLSVSTWIYRTIFITILTLVIYLIMSLSLHTYSKRETL